MYSFKDLLKPPVSESSDDSFVIVATNPSGFDVWISSFLMDDSFVVEVEWVNNIFDAVLFGSDEAEVIVDFLSVFDDSGHTDHRVGAVFF